MEVATSTQSLALHSARSGASIGTWFVADRQRDGRGRDDRTWWSPEGGLYLSYIAPDPGASPALAPLAAAVAAAEAAEVFGATPALQWPNDLIVVGPAGPPRKLAGTLIDGVRRANGPGALVVGIGINIYVPVEPVPSGLALPPAFLAEFAKGPIDRTAVEAELVAALRGMFDRRWDDAHRASILARGRRRLYGRGRPATVDGRPAGRIRDLAEDGGLLLDQGPSTSTVWSGRLRVEAA